MPQRRRRKQHPIGMKTKMIISDFRKSFSSFFSLFLGLNENGSGNRKNKNKNGKNNQK
jgi:amino acid permease